MADLKKAYEAINMLKSIGMQPSTEQLRAIRQMENDYLQEVIIPLMKTELEPLFSQLRGGVKLDFSYSPESGVTVSPFTPRVEQIKYRNSRDENGRASRKKLKYKIRVDFPDNTVSCKVPVLETLMDVVRYATPERVQKLNMMVMGDNIVSSKLNPDERYRAGQKEIKPGLYVCTFSSTDTKYEQIMQINKALALGLKVSKIII